MTREEHMAEVIREEDERRLNLSIGEPEPVEPSPDEEIE